MDAVAYDAASRLEFNIAVFMSAYENKAASHPGAPPG
jgi:hypothetical protein